MPDDKRDAYDYLPATAVAEVLRRATAHLGELLVSEVQTEGGDIVLIVCVPEVRSWLHSLASKVEHGEPLARPPAER